jgi:N-acetylneuraminate synthase
LLKGQLSCREILNGQQLINPVQADKPLMIDDIDSPYARNGTLRDLIYERGL